MTPRAPYTVVTTENFQEVLTSLSKEKLIYLDTETTGLRPYHGHRMFSLILAGAGPIFYFSFQPYDDQDEEVYLPRDPYLDILRTTLFASEKTWVASDLKYDMHILWQDQIELKGPLHCTMIMHRLIKSDAMKGTFDLDTLGSALGYPKDDVKEYIDKHKLYTIRNEEWRNERIKDRHYDRLPFDVIAPYAARDIEVLRTVYRAQMEKFKALELSTPENLAPISAVVENESRLIRTVWEMERDGILLDRAFCISAIEEADRLSLEAKGKLSELLGSEYKSSTKTHEKLFADQKEKWVYGEPTKKGQVNAKFDKKTLTRFEGEAAGLIRTYKENESDGNFFRGFLSFMDASNRVHARFNQHGTTTGRFCIAEGTPIEVVRDLSESPKGIPIERVQVGDMAYCYDDSLNLRLARVLWAGKTGHKKVIRIHWQGQGNKHEGYLDCTPEHQVRLVDGSYKPAKELQPLDRLLALGRSKVLGYGRLHSRKREIRDHRFIYSEFHGIFPEHVHHRNENKLDNRLSNLEGLTSQEHTSLHAKQAWTPERKAQQAILTAQKWVTGEFKPAYGKDAGSFKEVSRFTLLRLLAKSRGRPSKIEGPLNDFDTFRKKCSEAGLDLKALCKRYSDKGYLSRGRVLATVGMKIKDAYTSLGLGHYAYKELKEFYGVDTNHRVLRIEEIDTPVDVYDLEIEGHHNFIASEICVHNSSSSPNLQNLKNEEGEEALRETFLVRRAIVPAPGNVFHMIDYKQMEYRLLIDIAMKFRVNSKGIEVLKNMVMSGHDVHQATGDLAGIDRKPAKSANFAIIYGAGDKTLAKGLGTDEAGAAAIRRKIFDVSPEIETLLQLVSNTAKQRKYVVSWFGRILRIEDPRFAYAAVNYLIQGGCADIVKVAMNRVRDYLQPFKTRLRLSVHDELVLEGPPSEAKKVIPAVVKIMESVYQSQHGVVLEVDVEHSFKSLADKEPGIAKA